MDFLDRQPLEKRDKQLLGLCLLVMLVGGLYVKANYSAAFPQASLELKLSKEEITQQAESFLRGQGIQTAGFRNLTLFDPDDDARMYLERELGLAQANRLMQQAAPVWRWRARWYKPPEKEEMVVYLSPRGRLMGFDHKVTEDAPATSVGVDRARAMAEEFLRKQSPAWHKVISDQVEKKTNREDYVFTWEEEGFKAKDAKLRRTVVVQGDRLGRYTEELHVPEQWQRDFAGLRSSNELYASIAQGIYVLLALWSLVVIFGGIRKRAIPWRGLLRIAGTVALLTLLNEWNELPFYLDRSPTSATVRESTAIGLLQSLGQAVFVLLYVLVAAAAGEPLYRRALPHRLQLGQVFTASGIRTKEFFLSTMVGYGFTAFHLMFLTAFYLVGSRFGVWSPQDVAYSEILATPVPFLYPLAIAAMAASAEEFWFRLLAIPLLSRYVKWRWVAVVIPAFVWGFLHANYPQQPGYIRGVEVGLIGVGAGLVMVRFGIVATLVWHYTVDAGLIGSFLLQADGWVYRVSGLLVAGLVALPLLVSLVQYRRYGGFLHPEDLQNDAVADALGTELRVEKREYVPPPAPARGVRWLWIAAGVAIAGGLILRPTRFGDFVSVRLTREEARAVADAELRGKHDVSGWLASTDFVSNLHVAEFEYLREQAGTRQAIETVRDRTATGIWRTRYFRPQQSEEWLVYVNQQGHVERVDHNLDEKARGGQLSAQEARRRVDAYLRQRLGAGTDKYTLVDSQEEKFDARSDHGFIFEDPEFRIGEAKARVSVQLVGEDISDFRRFLKLPEQWLREFRKPRIFGYLLYAAFGAIVVPLLLRLIFRLSHHEHVYHWRVYSGVSAAMVVLGVLSEFNEWPVLLSGYDTSTPLANFYGRLVAGDLQSLVMSGLAGFAGAFVLDVFLQMRVGLRSLPRPSLARAAAIAGLLWGAQRILSAVHEWVPGPRASLPLWDVPGVDTWMPAFAVVRDAFDGALLAVCGFGALLCGALVHFRPATFRLVLLGVAAAYGASQALNGGQAVVGSLIGLAAIGVAAIVVWTVATDLITIAIGLFWLSAIGAAWALFQQPSLWLKENGVAAALSAILVGWGAYYWDGRNRRSTGTGV